MADRVVLHIGTMKSGTTYLQDVLGRGGAEPGGGFLVGGSFGVQTAAVAGMLGPGPQVRPKKWRALVAEAGRGEGVALVSHEFLSFVRRARVADLVASFGGTPVDVVLTVRDQHGAIPAQWQSFVRNRGLVAWPGYLRALATEAAGPGPEADPGPDPGRTFRRAQDVPRILRRWSGHEGVSSISVVVVPPAGSDPAALWQRFCAAAGVDPAGPPPAVERANESLGYASCDALRRLNRHLAPLGRKRYQRVRAATLPGLLPLRGGEARPPLAASGAALAGELNARIVAALAELDVRLVGDAAELPRGTAPASPEPPDPPEEEQVRRALRAAWRQNVDDVAPPDADCDEISAALGRRLVERFA